MLLEPKENAMHAALQSCLQHLDLPSCLAETIKHDPNGVPVSSWPPSSLVETSHILIPGSTGSETDQCQRSQAHGLDKQCRSTHVHAVQQHKSALKAASAMVFLALEASGWSNSSPVPAAQFPASTYAQTPAAAPDSPPAYQLQAGSP